MSINDLYDQIAQKGNVPTPSELSDYANDVRKLSDEIEELESRVKVLKKRRQLITHSKMPDLMNELRVDQIVVDGRRFSKDLYVSGVWPKEEVAEARALLHLEELGDLEIVKTTLIAEFERDEIELARYCREKLKDLCESTIKTAVHPMTFRAHIKKQILAGRPIDPQELGATTSSFVKMTKVR